MRQGTSPPTLARARTPPKTRAGSTKLSAGSGKAHTWSGSQTAPRVPDMGDPELQQFVSELATAQDERVDRLGEHAAEAEPAWAVEALGPVPDDPVDRLDWTQRAGKISSYRERYGIEGV